MSRFNPSMPKEPKGTITVSRTKWYQGMLNVTTDTDTTFRTQHEVLTDCYDLRLVYGNFYQDDDPARLANTAAYTLQCVVEMVVGGATRFIDVSWGSSGHVVTVPPGGWVESNKVSLRFKKGDKFFVRGRAIPESGGKFPYGLIANARNGEGKMAGDQLRATTFNAATLAVLSPLAIYATPIKPFDVVACIGDSISLGAGNVDTNTEGHLAGEVGFMQLGAMRTGKGYISLGMNGQSTSGFAEDKRYRRMRLATDCTIAICNYGTNDMVRTDPQAPTLEQLKANMQDMWNDLHARGLKVYQTTITPHTNKKADWATDGQTPTDARTAGGPDSMRSQLNTWIRTKPFPLAGVIDAASAVETGENTGLWQDDTTVDGIHPNERGHNLMADVTQRAIE